MKQVKQLVQSAKLAFDSAQNNRELIEPSIKECSSHLRVLRQYLKRARTVGQKQNLTNGINLVEGYRAKVKKLKNNQSRLIKKRASWTSIRVKWEDVQSAFSDRMRTGVILNLTHKEPKDFFEDCAGLFRRRINNALKKEAALKVNSVFCGEFKIAKGDEEVFDFKYMNTKNAPIYRNTNINDWFNQNVIEPIMRKLEEFQEKDSGWALSTIVNLAVNINTFTPQLGSSYISLPKQIENKKACINIQNADDACFAWAVVSALHPYQRPQNPNRTSSYPHYSSVLNLDGIAFPMTIKQIPRFEKQNDNSINVYILRKMRNEQFKIFPTYLTQEKKERHVNLLMIQNVYYDENEEEEEKKDDDEPVRYHYVWIKNLSRLLSSQLSKDAHQKYFCDRCLHYFYSPGALEQHVIDCQKLNDSKIRLPTEDQKELRFKNFRNKVEAPFVIYADLECLLVECSDKNKYQNHIPCSVGFYVKCSYDPTLSVFKSYRGEDCIEWFVSELEQFAEDLETVFLCPLPMNQMTAKEIEFFGTSTLCHICEKPFTSDDEKVRDHCHLTGKYRGPAHEGCNINFQDSHTIPVIFHNLSGYDSHFIIKNIASDLQGRIDLLPINTERYISFTKHLDEYPIKFRFIDSFKFMASSLDTLSSYLTTFPILKSQFQNLKGSHFNLLTRKGVYPYDYFNCTSKFLETKLPEIEQFYNILNESNISPEDYAHACNVWKEFGIQNLGEYSNLYLKTDVLLLADVFEQFRSSCRETYGLDPAHYYTLPGYTWDAMLKHTSVTLELLTDVDILLFIELGIRGGLSQCSKRYSKANNKYMPDYDSSQPSKFLMYNDINNQYGWAMSQLLPHSGFKWVEHVSNFKVEDVADDSPIGYILEVDLEYPREIHDLHKDLPFCPEHCSAPNSKQKKLMATLSSKTKYVIHYRSLKQALLHGLKLTKIHRVLQFNQSTWLKSYIDLNTSLRALAKNDFQKNLFKLMNNAVFGKTMENVRKHSIVKLVTKWCGRYGAEALISKPEFKASTIFNENLVAVELKKTEIYFNKPIYVGMCILDLAKTTIYDFHYNYMIPQFNSNCTVCYTDTDSLIYEVTCADLYEITKRDCHSHFDTSDYPPNNIWNIPLVNKKVLGLMKDENNGLIMTEFVGLRSKMYAIRVEGKDKIKKSKGVKKNIVKNRITFDDYLECLNNSSEKLVSQNLIQSQKHQVSTITQSKIALSPHDDKRYLIPNSSKTLPWGHFSIMNVD